ncbi:hypothetical protein BDBG_05753 [Blastomyces gilchristii SLH14081]|uniref:Uncharacterized protein n=2 Tax=Blastomyces TaxID=229219 RepID=A0A179UQC2_BLAGS|nr:uncharacterized protein BDBG_05753 [Blastomyces gilchristii SLH14081]EGE78036.1 hypothetical protein BDDG_00973 [Blastomyces dermatitidis ATCC 18188]OAT10070.1 hypothetical protein BDBG_05753 [Blastomyces gilchristii SLH14081]
MCDPANTGADWRCSSSTTNSFQEMPEWDQYAQRIYQLGINHGLCDSNQGAAYPQPIINPAHRYGPVPCDAGPKELGNLPNSAMPQHYQYLQATQATQAPQTAQVPLVPLATQATQAAQSAQVPRVLQATHILQATQAAQATHITSQPFLGHAQANMPINRAMQPSLYPQPMMQPTPISAAKRGHVHSLVTMDNHEWNTYGNYFSNAQPQLTAQSSDLQCSGGYPVHQPVTNNMHYGSGVPKLEGRSAATYGGRIMDEPTPVKLLVKPVTTRVEPAGAIASLKRAAVSRPNAPRHRPAPNLTKLTNEHRVRKRRIRNDSPLNRCKPDMRFPGADVLTPENECAVSDGSPQVETDSKNQVYYLDRDDYTVLSHGAEIYF